MASFYRTTAEEFIVQADAYVIAQMAVAYANRGYTSQYSDQTLTWERDIRSLKQSLRECLAKSSSARSWGVILEFSIPRKELRIDAVLLIRETVVILEAKSGQAALAAERQIEEYALLLHYFHKASSDHRIIPIIVSPEDADWTRADLEQRESLPQLPTYWVSKVLRCSWQHLSDLLIDIERLSTGQLSFEAWENDLPPIFSPRIMRLSPVFVRPTDLA